MKDFISVGRQRLLLHYWLKVSVLWLQYSCWYKPNPKIIASRTGFATPKAKKGIDSQDIYSRPQRLTMTRGLCFDVPPIFVRVGW